MGRRNGTAHDGVRQRHGQSVDRLRRGHRGAARRRPSPTQRVSGAARRPLQGSQQPRRKPGTRPRIREGRAPTGGRRGANRRSGRWLSGSRSGRDRAAARRSRALSGSGLGSGLQGPGAQNDGVILMAVAAIVRRWLDGLAGLLLAWREKQRARQGVLISREDAHFVVRSRVRGRESVPQTIVAGAALPPGLANLARNGAVTLEFKEVVVRRIQVPAPAREFLPGIVRNQIDRLSPWRANETLYGFDSALKGDDPGTLDVCILMQSRAVIDAARDQVAAIGLVVNQIVASDPPLVGPITLWSQLSQASAASLRRARWLLGGAIIGMLLVSLGVSVWA